MMEFSAEISKKQKIAVVGLGYVGLPLAVEFGKVVKTMGFDINKKRIAELNKYYDYNNEITKESLKASALLEFSFDFTRLKESNFIIVAVPTPITKHNAPDLCCLESATELVARNMKEGSIVVFESTVYPGVTEDVCVPILEKFSGLKYKKDFKVGYSPERINPGDTEHTISKVIKVVSGCDGETLDKVAVTYGLVARAGVHRAESIKCAEAAKVIENTQRDLNIALMNELAIIFNKMGIDTRSVLWAAGTKWNFIKMSPGLVGGHCIGVDPYYLTFKAEEVGYNPQVILAGRRINDNMGKYIAEQTVKLLIRSGKTVKASKVMIMGITFKENIKDIRNSRVIDIINELKQYGIDVLVCDPLADKEEVRHEYGIKLEEYDAKIKCDAIIIAVNHAHFEKILSIQKLKTHLSNKNGKGVVIDVKGMFGPDGFNNSGLLYWRL
ncbi:MAG: nucleotide sugar dehydrogenase [bacterium]